MKVQETLAQLGFGDAARAEHLVPHLPCHETVGCLVGATAKGGIREV